MESILPTLAFALLIGGQFLAAIVLTAKRKTVYGALEKPKGVEHPPSEHDAIVNRGLPAKA
jgi:hypothetical protein